MRIIDGGSNQLYYLFTDHLGSTSEVRRADGSLHSRQFYMAFGEERYTYNTLPTDRTYTGQREIEFGLVHYGARIYDPVLARWVQPDSIIPESSQGIQAWDRYTYVNNSPMRYNDPSGNCAKNDKPCIDKLTAIEKKYGVDVVDDNGLWTLDDLSAIESGMSILLSEMGEKDFHYRFDKVTFSIEISTRRYMWTTGNRDVVLPTGVSGLSDYIEQETTHELAHIWDDSCNDCMSLGMALVTGSYYDSSGLYFPMGQPPTDHATKNKGEDWAESVVSILYSGYAQYPKWSDSRKNYVSNALQPSRLSDLNLRVETF